MAHGHNHPAAYNLFQSNEMAMRGDASSVRGFADGMKLGEIKDERLIWIPRSAITSAKPNRAASPAANPNAKVHIALRRFTGATMEATVETGAAGALTGPAGEAGVTTIACSRSIKRRAI
jgi:hypothetical protein